MFQFTLRRARTPAKFPNRIREYRLRAELTQKRLGEITSKGRSIISAWERGRMLPSLLNAFRLARSLDTLPEMLYPSLYEAARPTTSA